MSKKKIVVDSTPLISIITINWNTTAVTGEFLQSILSSNTYPNVEVIVVDNASKQDPSATLKAIYPELKLILNTYNAAFADGNNACTPVAAGDFLFLVHKDTEITPRLPERLPDTFPEFSYASVDPVQFH